MSGEGELLQRLSKEYGPMIGGPDLTKVLGFRTAASFRRAVNLGQVNLKMFNIEGRRGQFAFTQDIAAYLYNLSKNTTNQPSADN